jgi:hypothetical protein
MDGYDERSDPWGSARGGADIHAGLDSGHVRTAVQAGRRAGK